MARLLDLRTPFTPLNPAGALLMLTRFRKFLVLAVIAVMTVTGAGQTLAAERKTTTVHKKQKVAKVATAKKKAVTTKKVRVTKKKTVRKIAKPAAASASTAWQDTQKLAVRSSSALVIDPNGGTLLFEKNADVVAPIASITKLMTAMVVLDGTPNLQETITITEDDVDTLRGSHSRLQVGATLPRESALLLALMSSENRAAHALARHYPGGMLAFLSAMNIKAQALGMRDTHFDDPTGLNSNNVATANDLAKMVIAAHRYPLIREFTTTTDATVSIKGRELVYRNTNPLVKSSDWDVGLSKTGYIQEAGKCLVMQAHVAAKTVVIVLLDSAGKLTRVGDANRIRRWMESTYAAHQAQEKTAMSPAHPAPARTGA